MRLWWLGGVHLVETQKIDKKTQKKKIKENMKDNLLFEQWKNNENIFLLF